MKFSIIIVTRNSADVLPACLESVVDSSAQTDYEVIIVDNASTDESENIFQALEGDIAIIRNEYNAGFARACNQGIALAKGDIIVLLNPDTLVTSNWLGKLSAHLQDSQIGAVGPLSNYVAGLQKYELFYQSGNNATPHDINTELERQYRTKSLETKFLIGFCLALPRKIIEQVGAFDDDLLLGNEDLEFSHRLRQHGFKLLAALDTFIYHKGHTSFNSETDSDRWVNFSARILQAKMERQTGAFNPRKIWGMDWFQPQPNLQQDLVSIVIPTFNGIKYTKICLESIRRCTMHPYEIIAVDNASTDGTVEYLKEQPDVRLIENSVNKGFPAACNQGIDHSSAPYILLLNNDVVTTEGWLHRMFEAFFIDPAVALVGPRTNDCAGFQKISAPNYQSLDELEKLARRIKKSSIRQFRRVNYLTGFALLIDRKVIEKVGKLDERFGIGNYEDQDFCRRAEQAGFKLFIANEVYLHHFGSRAFVENNLDYQAILKENRRKFQEKWSVMPA